VTKEYQTKKTGDRARRGGDAGRLRGGRRAARPL